METNTKTQRLLRKYNRLEANNDHNEAAQLLVDAFGTQEEQDIVRAITAAHEKRGFIEPAEIDQRREVSQKYYKLLHKFNIV